ncbi:phosphoadenylyl-sulfate reductase [uncultured Reyranella sp.]|uniref:phosphoadenylyl-sulfate reductase n=1 Tax=uncultured Reyranella sp. TaxID=735512 RepID=UPI0026000C9D|nr:phosphoadenylyl-sulfate reductase [uncultured Reyranella sp.]
MPTPAEHVIDLRRRLDGAAPARILRAALGEIFTGRIAVVSSFGTDSAVLLHLVAEIDRATPVLFVDTGRHFPETLQHRDRLVRHLALSDVRSIGPSAEEVARRDADLSRATWDPDGCCAFRKIAPLQRALSGFDAWITGRKRFQAATRRELAVFEVDGAQAKINPLARWSQAEIDAYAARHGLPGHPLASRGYPSIGCAPCTSAILPGEDPRAGRWRGVEKTECGIHRPAAALLAAE